MPISEQDHELMRKIAKYYRSTKNPSNPEGSIRDTANHFGMNRNKIRKILITTGDITSPITEKAAELRKQGKSIREIAEALGVSVATVSVYLPYEATFGNTLSPSQHTLNVRGYRAYERRNIERSQRRVEEKKITALKGLEEKKTIQAKKVIGTQRNQPGVSNNIQPGVSNNIQPGENTYQSEREQSDAVKKATPEATVNTAVETAANTVEDVMTTKTTGDKTKNSLSYILPAGLLRIHVELDYLIDEDIEVLKKYGSLKHGNTISRDIIVPAKMPLNALHYTLQRAFGFQDSHLHNFSISTQDMIAISDDKMENLLNLRGVVFSCVSDDDEDNEPIYRGGSFKRWLRKQYTYPWNYSGDTLDEVYENCYNNVSHRVDNHWHGMEDDRIDDFVLRSSHPDDEFILFKILHPYKKTERLIDTMPRPAECLDDLPGTGDCVKWLPIGENPYVCNMVRCSADDPYAMSVEKIRLGDLNVESGLKAIFDCPKTLIERLPIDSVLAMSSDCLPYDGERKIRETSMITAPQIISTNIISKAIAREENILPKPFTDTLIYEYDPGDSWCFRITGSRGCTDLINSGLITVNGLEKSVAKVIEELHPILIARDGDMLIEDIGGVPGFIEFLQKLHMDPGKIIEQENDYSLPRGKDEIDEWIEDLLKSEFEKEENEEDEEEHTYKILQDPFAVLDDEDDENVIDTNDLDADDDLDELDENLSDNHTDNECDDECDDENENKHDNSWTNQELLDWAISQGWHRNDTADINLL